MEATLTQNKPKTILILGGGYAGLKAFNYLSKHLPLNNFQVKLIDKAKRHIYTAELPGVNKSENLNSPKHGYESIIKRPDFFFINKEVHRIDPVRKTVIFTDFTEENYDLLSITLGSISNYFNIPGIQENSYPLKSISDSEKISQDLVTKIKQHFEQKATNDFSIVIGGGGFTGAELACEIKLKLENIENELSLPKGKIKVTVLQALPEMIGLGTKVHNLVIKRFNQLGINWQVNATISAFESGNIQYKLAGHDELKFIQPDFFIWTAGVKPNPTLANSFAKIHPSNALEVNEFLQSKDFPEIFAAGDNAFILDQKTQKPIPKTGQMAVQEGLILGRNLLANTQNQPLKSFHPFFKGFVIQMGGIHAIYSRNDIAFAGFIPYLLRRYVDLNYYLSILPPQKAIKKWLSTINIFLQND